MKGTGWIVGMALLLGGCAGDRVRSGEHGLVLELDQVMDEELRASGEWTEADARARALIGPERGRMLGQYRPTRRPSVARKLAGLSASVLTLCGWSYEKPWHYVPEHGVYVFIHRDRAPSIVSEEWQGGIRPADPEIQRWPSSSGTWPRPPSDEELMDWTRPTRPRWLPDEPPPEEGPVRISRADLR